MRRARRAAKTQQRQLFALELEGIVALTLHSVTRTLTIAIERPAGAQVVDTLNEALRDRRRALQQEAGQLQQDGQERAQLPARPSPAADAPRP